MLTKVATAKKNTKRATAKERIQVEVIGSYGEDEKPDLDTLKANLATYIPEAIVEGDAFPLTVTLDGDTFTIDANGNVEFAGPTALISDIKLLDGAGAEVTEENRPEEGATGYQASFKVTLTEPGTINSVTFEGNTLTETDGVYKIPVTENTTYKVTVSFTVDGKTETKEKNVVIKDLFKSAAPIEAGDIATNPDIFKKVTEGIVLNYGDTLTVPDAEGSQVDLDVQWKVFYAEGNDIYLIASDSVPVSKLASQKTSLGFTDNGSYNIYWNSSSAFKGTTPINSTIASRFVLNELSKFSTGNSNYKMTACLLDASKWETFRDTRWADANNVIGSPTLEMWIASWNKKYKNVDGELFCNNASSTGYYVGTTSNPTSYYIDYNVMNKKQGYSDTLYYPHTGSSAWNSCYSYWLASPSASGSTNEMFVDYYGSVGNNIYSNNGSGVRPLVHLKSGVKVKPQGKDFVLVSE